MRIRYWSSDVCSSDLLFKICTRKIYVDTNAISVNLGLGQRANRSDSSGSFDKFRTGFVSTLLCIISGEKYFPSNLAISQRPEVDQIGRASCRERVCQNVSIS